MRFALSVFVAALSSLPSFAQGSFPSAQQAWTVTEDVRFASNDTEFGEDFGYAVAVSEDYLLVGAKSAGPTNAGAVYVYARTGPGGAWALDAKLEGVQPGDRFGYAVAIFGKTAAIGVPGFGSSTGAVQLFRRGTFNWTPSATIVPSDGDQGDLFGSAVAISGDTIVVGALRHDNTPSTSFEEGAAYVYRRSGPGWVQEAKMPGPYDFATYGYSVAIEEDRVVVGALETTIPGGPSSGFVDVFERSLGVWTRTATLAPAPADKIYSFGLSVATAGERIAVSTSHELTNPNSGGVALVFRREGSAWVQEQKLYASDGVFSNQFGACVDLDGESLLVGSPATDVSGVDEAGAAYLFTRVGQSWSETARLVAGDPQEESLFGLAVALGGGRAVVGARMHDVDDGHDGAGYEYCAASACMPLSQSQTTLSLSAGGVQTLALRAGADYAGDDYVVIGSSLGTAPGFLVDGLVVPLVLDTMYSLAVLAEPNVPRYSSMVGQLDALGEASATITLAPGALPLAAAGVVVHHAALVIDATPVVAFTTNPAPLLLVP